LFIDEAFRGRQRLFGLCDDLDAGSTLHDLKTIFLFQVSETAKSQLASILLRCSLSW
jgi:hypothetical protein